LRPRALHGRSQIRRRPCPKFRYVVPHLRPPLLALVAAVTAGMLVAVPATADLSGAIQSSKGKDRSLSGQIGSDSRKLASFQGAISDLQERLSGLQQSLEVERTQLSSLQGRLRTAHAKLAKLKLAYAHDKRVLADQLVAQYEVERPDVVSVVLASSSFSDLVDTADNLKAVAGENAAVIGRVVRERTEVTTATKRLTVLVAQQQRVEAAALVQRDEVDSIKETLLKREYGVAVSRAKKQNELATLRANRKQLEHRLATIQAQAAGFSDAGPGLPAGGAGTFAGHGGSYGFFQAAGTNYSVGVEPTLAARLDVLGKALHLHLIGISGYRSPQHSIEVGGFADDPHTRGQASDTPGVEGVPEATLNHYGLTRPFAGAAEADHIQLK
jgi:peptidoglycan hydrolase CwlO-like protein